MSIPFFSICFVLLIYQRNLKIIAVISFKNGIFLIIERNWGLKNCLFCYEASRNSFLSLSVCFPDLSTRASSRLITKIRREKEGLLSSVRGKGKKKKKEKKKTKFWEEKEQGLFTYLLTAKSAEVAEAGQGRRHPEKNHFRSKTE